MRIAWKLFSRVLLLFLLIQCYPAEVIDIARPSAKLDARDVVETQLKALKYNDIPYVDAGIKTVYEFASPYHKAENGAFSEYRTIYNSQRFNTLINHEKFTIKEHFINDNKAEFFVFITDNKARNWVFIFRLSRMNKEPYENFWMTDNIMAYADARALGSKFYVV